MISTSGILSTGEKKCSPMKSSRPVARPSASPVIGSVEVLEHSSASRLTHAAISPKTWCLRCGFSKTASITRSQPARSAGFSVGVMRARISSAFVLASTCLGDGLVEQRLRVGLALLGRLDAGRP